MPGIAPIKLGSANTTGWTFQVGSQATTDQYGIQTIDAVGLFGDGSSVFSNIPAEGTGAGSVFGGGYLPSDFKLDFFEGTPKVEYTEGTTAKATFRFKRIDPTWGSRRTVSVDSIINYQNNALSQLIVPSGGLFTNAVFGFPDPVANVKFSSASPPVVGEGGLGSLYALPGSPQTDGFPDVPDIIIPITIPVVAGTVLDYWNGTAFVSFTAQADTTFVFNMTFKANPRGWQLVKLKYDPVANRSFFAIEEEWRNFYSFFGATFVSHTP